MRKQWALDIRHYFLTTRSTYSGLLPNPNEKGTISLRFERGIGLLLPGVDPAVRLREVGGHLFPVHQPLPALRAALLQGFPFQLLLRTDPVLVQEFFVDGIVLFLQGFVALITFSKKKSFFLWSS